MILNKKTFTKILISVLAVFLLTLSSCKAKLQNTDGKIQVVTTIFPEYDWLMSVAGPNNDAIVPKLLIKNGVDVHSYQPSAKDIVDICTADILMYVGGESDKWITEALKNATNPNMIVLNLTDLLKQNLYEEEIVEGMETETNDNEADDDEVEYDEHIWFSISNVKICTQSLKDALCKLDSENAEMYSQRLEKYHEKLNELDAKYKEVLSSAKFDTLIFGDRFPFRYLTEDYNLKYYAPFPGCSAETEASFETVTFLAEKINELNINNIIILESSKDKLAKTILNASNHKMGNVLVLDSMQSTTLMQIFNGKTYIGTMEDNLEVLTKALN